MKKIIIVVPTYNEEKVIEENLIKLNNFLKKHLSKYNWKIIVGDDSTDTTPQIVKRLVKKYPRIEYVWSGGKSKSRAEKKIWLSREADFYLCMDADLSADISHTPELIKGLEEGYDMVIGSRTAEESKRSRLINRKIISKTLIILIQTLFRTKITDFQCGLKGFNKKVIDNILPKMEALEVGFMDTEMIVVALDKKYKIKEIPVRWIDFRRDSKIPLFKGIIDGLLNLVKIKMKLIFGKYD